MKSRDQRYFAFFSASVVSFLLIIAGAETWARTSIRGESLSEALSKVSYGDSAVATLLMYAPFLVVAWLSASLARVSWPRATGLFLVCVAVFAAMYYSGYSHSEEYMLQRKWTAAALAIGLVPFETLPVLVIAAVARLALGRLGVPPKTLDVESA